MDYFENLVKRLLESEGYWVKQSVKVNLTKSEKKELGKPSIPRPEIDLIGYKPLENKLLIMEVKSYLDSSGVSFSEISKNYKIPEGRYKLFTCSHYRNIIFKRLVTDLYKQGLIIKNPKLVFALAAGNVHSKDEPKIKELFKSNGWFFYSPGELADAVRDFANIPYDNDPFVMTSKLLAKNTNTNDT